MVLGRSKAADRIERSGLKLLHTVWLVDLYNHLSSPVGVGHIAKGCEKAAISGLLDGQTNLPQEYPLTDIELALDID